MWKSLKRHLSQRNRTSSLAGNKNSHGITQSVMAKNRSISKLIYYYNNHSSSDRESCALSFLNYFLLVLLGLLCPCQVTRLLITNSMVVFLFSLAYLNDSGPDSFLSCLGSFGCCFHSSLRLFVTPLFLIIID